MLCLVAVGCTTSSSDPEPTPAPSTPATSSAPDPTSPVTLQLAVHGDATLRDAYRELARTYTAQNPSVTVEVRSSRTEEQAAARLDQAFASGDAPDLFVSSSERIPALVNTGRLQPVDQLLESRGVLFGDSFQRLGLEAFSAESALQCMPVDVSPLVVFYNQGLVPFRRLVEPGEEPLTPETGWTWDQFAKAARIISKEGAREGIKGVYVEPQLSALMAFVRSGGDDIVDDPREATALTLSDSGTRTSLEEVLEVVRDRKLTPTRKQLARVDGLTRFARGKVGMVVATKAAVPALREADDLDFDVFPLPRLGRDRSVAEVSGLCLSAPARHAPEAADFLAFAAGAEGAAILAETGAVVPAHLPTLNSLSFTQPGTQPESVLVFPNAVAGSGVVPFVPGWPALEEAMAPELERMWYDVVINLDTMLPRLDARSQVILAPATPPEE